MRGLMEHGYFERQNKGLPHAPYVDFNIDVMFNYLPHYHEELEVIYTESGRMNITVGNREVPLDSGDIFTVSPSTIHSFRSDSICRNCIMKFHTPSILFDYELTFHVTPTDTNYCRLDSLIKSIINESRDSLPCREIAMSALSEEFMLTLVRQFGAKRKSTAELTRNHRYIEISSKIAEYFEAHYSEDITLETLADACGYSRYYLSRGFKEITSLSFSDFASSFRIEKAKRMLADGHGILDAAFACGFNNPRSFNRSFRKFAGQTPSEYIAAKKER